MVTWKKRRAWGVSGISVITFSLNNWRHHTSITTSSASNPCLPTTHTSNSIRSQALVVQIQKSDAAETCQDSSVQYFAVGPNFPYYNNLIYIYLVFVRTIYSRQALVLLFLFYFDHLISFIADTKVLSFCFVSLLVWVCATSTAFSTPSLLIAITISSAQPCLLSASSNPILCWFVVHPCQLLDPVLHLQNEPWWVNAQVTRVVITAQLCV